MVIVATQTVLFEQQIFPTHVVQVYVNPRVRLINTSNK